MDTKNTQEFLNVPKGVVLKEPVHLGFNNRIIMEEDSEATVVESSFGNIQTNVKIGQNARLTWVKVLDGSATTPCVSSFVSEQSASSILQSQVFDLGVGVSQNEMRATLQGEGAACSLEGLYILGEQQSSSHQTCIDHVVPHARSEEFYKGILFDRAEGNFQGKIIVRPQAQKTVARQTNKNLLLSKDAIIHTKPLLEIFANDVKCNHGATIGQLDEQALFYLRTRGISNLAAKHMLTSAYASDMVGRVQNESLRNWIQNLVAIRLGKIHFSKDVV